MKSAKDDTLHGKLDRINRRLDKIEGFMMRISGKTAQALSASSVRYQEQQSKQLLDELKGMINENTPS